MPSLFDEVPWWTTADMNNALARENRPKPRGFRLNSSDRINAEYGPLVYDDPSATAFANDQSQKLIEQRGQPGVISKLLIGGAANALDAAGIPGVFDPDGTVRGQTWGNALRASSWIPQDTVEGVGQAITAPARAYRGEIPDEDMISEGLNFAGNMAMTGSIAPKPSNAAGMFGGRLGAENLAKKGETRPLRMLDMLDEMQKAGATREEIWDATRKIGEGSPYIGAHSGVDKIGRFEIDDSKAGALPSPGVTLAGKSEHSVPIGERIIHPEYMSAYPDAAGLNVQPIAGRMNSGAAGKYYNGKGFAYDASAPDRGRSIALHELQHDAQSREGFSLGGTPDMFWTDKRSLFGQGEAVDKYRRLAGETEARTVQKRADLTPEQRSSRPPWLDYDVPESQQIVRLGANTTEASAPGVVVAEAARQPRPVQMEVPFYRGSGHGQTSVDYSQPYWGTSDKGLASDYAKSRSRTYFDAEATPNVTPAVARFRNPLHIDAQNAGWSEVPFEGQKWNTDKLAETAKQRGHDGLVIDRLYDEGRWNPDEGLPSTVAALRPGTVSSAFDPNNILYQNAKNAAPAGVLISNAGDQAPRVGDDPLIELLRRYGVTR